MTHIENYAFDASKLRILKVENCEHIEEKAFMGLHNIKIQCGKLNLNNV